MTMRPMAIATLTFLVSSVWALDSTERTKGDAIQLGRIQSSTDGRDVFAQKYTSNHGHKYQRRQHTIQDAELFERGCIGDPL